MFNLIHTAAFQLIKHTLFNNLNMNKSIKIAICISAFFLFFTPNINAGLGKISILSCILRDRVLLTDKLFMKKALFVAFKLEPSSDALKEYVINGTIFCMGNKIAHCIVNGADKNYGNMIFDLPYFIPEGQYDIKISAFSSKGLLFAKGSIITNRSKLMRYVNGRRGESKPDLQEISQPKGKRHFFLSEADKFQGSVIFSRSSLRYVFPKTIPEKKEIKDGFDLIMAQNEFEPLTFTIFPLRDLGKVTVSISDLVGTKGTISKNSIKICHVEEVESTLGMPDGKYRRIPNLLRPINKVRVKKGRCERFWLTAWVGLEIQPGLYKGTIQVEAQFGETHHFPFNIKVVPILLSDIPKIDYFMLMTYEFVEMAMPWSKKDKEKIYDSALAILRDYKNHGMTTACFHSPFVRIVGKDGSTNLEDIYAALKGTREAGFTRPIIYYMGHLIQTAKPQHPGNINSFDDKVQINRLKNIVKKIREFSRENDCPDVIFLPIDEPEDRYSDPSGRRQKMAPILLGAIHKMGAKTMITGSELNDNIDYICSQKLDKKQLLKANQNDRKYWIYDNAVTLTADNPAYARYKYGYYVWREGIDGITSWTFQNTQNAAGLPGVADTQGKEIFLAYPDPRNPLSTLHWEAIREGIDDHKLIYQLEQRIRALNQIGLDTKEYSHYLVRLKRKQSEPGFTYKDASGWAPAFFESARKNLISLILRADKDLVNGSNKVLGRGVQ